MKKTAWVGLLAMVVLRVSGLAHAQINGCSDSPENPTAVLLVVGVAAYAWPSVRAKLRRTGRK